jgi:hypothetical protein
MIVVSSLSCVSPNDYKLASAQSRQKICNAGRQLSNYDYGASAAIPVDGIPIPVGFDFGVSDDSEYSKCTDGSNSKINIAQSQLCYSSSGQKRLFKFDEFLSSTISQNALQAWQSCLKLQSNFVDIDVVPTPDQLSANISLVYRGTGIAPNVYGLDVSDQGEAECKVTLPNKLGGYETTPMTDATFFKLGTEFRNISCNRKPSPNDAQGSVYYLPVRLTVKTDSGNFIMDMPAVGQAPLVDIQTTVNEAKQGIQQDVNSSIDSLKSDLSGTNYAVTGLNNRLTPLSNTVNAFTSKSYITSECRVVSVASKAANGVSIASCNVCV